MKYWWITLSVLLACGSSTAPVADTSTGTLDQRPASALRPMDGRTIVSYNVENLFDTEDDPATNDEDYLPNGSLEWTEERYVTKLERLAEAISWPADGPPVIVGLMEVENRTVVEALARTGALKSANYTVVHHDSPDERGIDVALLVDPRYVEVKKEEALTVPLDGDHTRDVLYAELGLAGGARLHVFVNHWPSRRDGEKSVAKRVAAAQVVRQRVDALLKQDPPAQVLIMGDFNDTPTDISIQNGLRAACDVQAKADLFDLMCIGQPKGHGSYNYQGEWSYLDQLIVSRSLLDRVKEAKAHWDDRLLFKHPRYGRSPDRTYAGRDYKGGYSDHLPVVLRLK